MCTLVVAIAKHAGFPIVVAANRDERLDRPSEGWARRDLGDHAAMAAPRDLFAGGTWIGVSARGLVAAVTNYQTERPEPARRSRGQLPGLALRAPSAAAARSALEALDVTEFNPFHLLVADAEQALLWRYDGTAAALETLAPGLHVITESSPRGVGPRGDLIRAGWPADPEPVQLGALLTVHGAGDPRAGTCIHMGARYGTRSSVILRLGPSLRASELLVTDGPPCQSPYQDRSALLGALAAC